MSEERVENALRHLGEDLRYTNPAQAALRQSRRMRVRRNVFTGAGAALALAAIAVPFAYTAGETPAGPPVAAMTPPAASPTASPTASPPVSKPAPPGSVALPGGVYVASATNDSGKSRIYDRKLHKYRLSGYPQAWASPDGKLAVVADQNHRLGILDIARDAVRWITGSKLEIGTPEWSRDGRRVVFAGPGPDQPTLSIVLVDVATAKARTLRPSVPCVELCQPSWLPGDQEVGLPEVSQPRAALLAYSVVDGRSRRVPMQGAVQACDAWSPDGRYVVAETGIDNRWGIGILEAATGEVVTVLDIRTGDGIQARSVVWATTDRIVAAGTREFVVYSTEGKEVQRIPLPAALRGVENALGYARP